MLTRARRSARATSATRATRARKATSATMLTNATRAAKAQKKVGNRVFYVVFAFPVGFRPPGWHHDVVGRNLV